METAKVGFLGTEVVRREEPVMAALLATSVLVEPVARGMLPVVTFEADGGERRELGLENMHVTAKELGLEGAVTLVWGARAWRAGERSLGEVARPARQVGVTLAWDPRTVQTTARAPPGLESGKVWRRYPASKAASHLEMLVRTFLACRDSSKRLHLTLQAGAESVPFYGERSIELLLAAGGLPPAEAVTVRLRALRPSHHLWATCTSGGASALQHLKDDTMPVTVTWDAAELRSELAPPWVCRWGRDEPMGFLEAVVVGTVRVRSSTHRLLLTLEEDGGWRHFFPFLSPREQRLRAGERVVCRAVPLAWDPRGAEVPHTRTFPRWRREGEHRFGRVVMGRAMAEVEAERVVVAVEWDRKEVVGSLEVAPGVVRVAHPATTGQLERWLRLHLRCRRAEDRLYLEVEGSNGKVTPYFGGVQDTRLLRTSGEWWWPDPLCSGEGAEQGPGARLLGGVQGGGRQEAAQALPPLLQGGRVQPPGQPGTPGTWLLAP